MAACALRRHAGCSSSRARAPTHVQRTGAFHPLWHAGYKRRHTDGRDRGHDLAKLQLVEDGGLASGVETDLRKEKRRSGRCEMKTSAAQRASCRSPRCLQGPAGIQGGCAPGRPRGLHRVPLPPPPPSMAETFPSAQRRNRQHGRRPRNTGGEGPGQALTMRMRISFLPTRRPRAFAKTPPILVDVWCW